MRVERGRESRGREGRGRPVTQIPGSGPAVPGLYDTPPSIPAQVRAFFEPRFSA